MSTILNRLEYLEKLHRGDFDGTLPWNLIRIRNDQENSSKHGIFQDKVQTTQIKKCKSLLKFLITSDQTRFVKVMDGLNIPTFPGGYLMYANYRHQSDLICVTYENFFEMESGNIISVNDSYRCGIESLLKYDFYTERKSMEVFIGSTTKNGELPLDIIQEIKNKKLEWSPYYKVENVQGKVKL